MREEMFLVGAGVIIGIVLGIATIKSASAQTRLPFSVYQSGHYCVFLTGTPGSMAIAVAARSQWATKCQ